MKSQITTMDCKEEAKFWMKYPKLEEIELK
jgi:hypothetical protein